MPSLDEREKYLGQTCNHCKHCAVSCGHRLSKDNKITWDYALFCMLDSPEEDRKFVERGVSELLNEDVFTVQSEQLLQLLQLDATNADYRKSPRWVSYLFGCQFYEPKDCWKDRVDTEKPLRVWMIPKDGLIPEKEDKEESKDA